jgi:hypothetical protein
MLEEESEERRVALLIDHDDERFDSSAVSIGMLSSLSAPFSISSSSLSCVPPVFAGGGVAALK